MSVLPQYRIVLLKLHNDVAEAYLSTDKWSEIGDTVRFTGPATLDTGSLDASPIFHGSGYESIGSGAADPLYDQDNGNIIWPYLGKGDWKAAPTKVTVCYVYTMHIGAHFSSITVDRTGMSACRDCAPSIVRLDRQTSVSVVNSVDRENGISPNAGSTLAQRRDTTQTSQWGSNMLVPYVDDGIHTWAEIVPPICNDGRIFSGNASEMVYVYYVSALWANPGLRKPEVSLRTMHKSKFNDLCEKQDGIWAVHTGFKSKDSPRPAGEDPANPDNWVSRESDLRYFFTQNSSTKMRYLYMVAFPSYGGSLLTDKISLFSVELRPDGSVNSYTPETPRYSADVFNLGNGVRSNLRVLVWDKKVLMYWIEQSQVCGIRATINNDGSIPPSQTWQKVQFSLGGQLQEPFSLSSVIVPDTFV